MQLGVGVKGLRNEIKAEYIMLLLKLKEASITESQSVWRFGHCLGLGVVDKLDRFSG